MFCISPQSYIFLSSSLLIFYRLTGLTCNLRLDLILLFKYKVIKLNNKKYYKKNEIRAFRMVS